MSWPNKTEYLWWPERRNQPTISVLDPAEGSEASRTERIKQGARVVPFGFSRALDGAGGNSARGNIIRSTGEIIGHTTEGGDW